MGGGVWAGVGRGHWGRGEAARGTTGGCSCGARDWLGLPGGAPAWIMVLARVELLLLEHPSCKRAIQTGYPPSRRPHRHSQPNRQQGRCVPTRVSNQPCHLRFCLHLHINTGPDLHMAGLKD